MLKCIKILFLPIIVSTLWAFTSFKPCKLLPNGVYLITYTSENAPKESRLIIQDDFFTLYESNGDSTTVKMKWLFDCTFTIEPDSKPKQATNHLDSLLHNSFGQTCIELKAAARDTIAFRTTYTGNVHITINEGKYIRIK